MSSAKTFDASVPSSIEEFFAVANIQPNYIPFSDLHHDILSMDASQKASFDHARKITLPGIFTHAIRCYLFALAILRNGFPSNTPGVPQISYDELRTRLFHACILHDLGLTRDPEALAHPAHAMSFELHGGIMAYEHLNKLRASTNAEMSTERLGDITQSIMLHTLPFTNGRSSAVGALLQLSAIFDITGYDSLGPDSLSRLLNKDTVREIEEAYPRGALGKELVEEVNKMLQEKPACLLTHTPSDFAQRASAIKSLVSGSE